MFRRYMSTDGLSSHRSDLLRSPYAKNYRTNLTHDQRQLLSHRQNVTKLPRHELEDRYLALIDDHFAVKKDNANNHEKIKKMATKLLRLSAEGKSKGTPFPLQLSPNEHLEVQIIKLESYNALLKERLHAIIQRYSSTIQSTATSAFRRPASCSNLSVKRKMAFSQDDINLLEIPQPPDIRSVVGTSSSFGEKKTSSKYGCKNYLHQHQQQHPHHHHFHQCSHSLSTILIENDIESTEPDQDVSVATAKSTNHEEKTSINDLKNTIQKLENELSEVSSKNDLLNRVNSEIKEKLTKEKLSQQITENVELVELRKTVIECEAELNLLRQEYVKLRDKAEADLDEEQKKISELTATINNEIIKNKIISKELLEMRNTINQRESSDNQTMGNKQPIGDDVQQPTDDLMKNRNILENAPSEDTEEVSNLLGAAKTTILDLQGNLSTLNDKVSELTLKNVELSNIISDLKKTQQSDENQKKQSEKEAPTTSKDTKQSTEMRQQITEPLKHVSVKPKGIQEKCEINEQKPSKQDEEEDDTDDTFTISTKVNVQRIANDLNTEDTDSDISSIESDKNFRKFQTKNKELQTTLLLPNLNGMPYDFAERLNLLERAAFYRPLPVESKNSNAKNISNDDKYVCSCNSSDCDRNVQSFYEEIKNAIENAKEILLKEIKRSTKTGFDHSKTNGLINDTSECRQLLRVQYNLNNLYKQELEYVCKVSENQLKQLVAEIEELRRKTEVYEDKLKVVELHCTDQDFSETMSSLTGRASQHLQISPEQGSFELHVDTLRLTKVGRSILSTRHGGSSPLILHWKFFDNVVNSTTTLKTGSICDFHSTTIYLVPMNETFLQWLRCNKMEIMVFAVTDRSSTPFGYATIRFGEVLLFPQNKIQLVTKVFLLECDCDSHAANDHKRCKFHVNEQKHLGNLSIWFRLTCELEVLKKFGTHFWLFGDKAAMPTQSNTGHSKALQRSSSHGISNDHNALAISEITHRKTGATKSDKKAMDHTKSKP